MTKLKQFAVRALAFVAGVSAAACGGASEPHGGSEQPSAIGTTAVPTPSPSTSVATPTPETKTPTNTTSCTSSPDLEGAWTGSAEGRLRGAIASRVDGTATMTMTAGASPVDFDVRGTMRVTFPDLAAVLGGAAITQPMTGTIHCGRLDATSVAEVIGYRVNYHVVCDFTEQGCANGEWTAETFDKSFAAQGSFRASRGGS